MCVPCDFEEIFPAIMPSSNNMRVSKVGDFQKFLIVEVTWISLIIGLN